MHGTSVLTSYFVTVIFYDRTNISLDNFSDDKWTSKMYLAIMCGKKKLYKLFK